MTDSEAPPAEDETPDDRRGGIGKRLLGLFVERDEDASAAAEAASEPAPGPASPPPAAPEPVPAAAPQAAPGASSAPGRPAPPAGYRVPDYPGIFKSAGMADEERDRLARAEELLKTLPPETPIALRRQIVEGTLRSFGIAPERLVQAAVRAADALGTYLKIGEDDLRARVEATEKRLTELRAEQERIAKALAERQAAQQTLAWDVRERQSQLRGVAEFFGGAAQPKPARGPTT